MFYTTAVLVKQGPLSRIWLASHWEKKLTKSQIFETDIGVATQEILKPLQEGTHALRLSSHLLLGVVRIYNRKVKYLLDDAYEAQIKLKLAFRPTSVDLPKESGAAAAQLTLPTSYGLELENAGFVLPDLAAFTLPPVDSATFEVQHLVDPSEITITVPAPEISRRDMPTTTDAPSDLLDELRNDMDAAGKEGDDSTNLGPAMTMPEGDDLLPFDMPDPSGGFDADFPTDFPDIFNEAPPAADATTGEGEGEGEGEAVAPVLEEAEAAPAKKKKPRRKARGFVVDDRTMLSSEFMRRAIQDTSDIVRDATVVPLERRALRKRVRADMASGTSRLYTPIAGGFARRVVDVLARAAKRPRIAAATATATDEPQQAQQAADEDEFAMPPMEDWGGMDPPDLPGDWPPMDDVDIGRPSVGGDDAARISLGGMSSAAGTPAKPLAAGLAGLRDMPGDAADTGGAGAAPAGTDDSAVPSGQTQQVLRAFANVLDAPDAEVSLDDCVESLSRVSAARAFYQVLVLKSKDIVDVAQDEPYHAIHVSRGPRWDTTLAAMA